MILNTWSKDRKDQAFLAIICLLFFYVLFWNTPWFFVAPFFLSLFPLILYIGFSKPAFFCLIFFAFTVFRFHEVIPILSPLHIPMISASLAIVSILYNLAFHRIDLYWRREMSYFSAFFLLVSVGVFISYNVDIAYDFWSSIFVKIGILFFLITWSLQDKKGYLGLIIIALVGGVTLAIITIYNQQHGIGLVEGTRASIAAKISSTIGDTNDLAFTLLIPLGFSCSVLLAKSIPILQRLFGLASCMLISVAIILTQSRGGLLGLLAILIYFFSRRFKSKALLIFVGGVLMVSLYLMAGIEHRESGGAGQGIDESSMARITAWKAAISMALHHPITGVGLHQFTNNFYNYTTAKEFSSLEVHSSWFSVLAESGFPGLILFITCVVAALKACRLSIQRLQTLNDNVPQKSIYLILAYGLYSGLIGYCVAGSFLTQGFTPPFYILFALSITLAHSTDKIFRNSRLSEL